MVEPSFEKKNYFSNDIEARGTKEIDEEEMSKEIGNGKINSNNLAEDKKNKKMINSKIEELNGEISKLKLENERVQKIRKKYEDLLKDLNQQKETFEITKAKEQESLENIKNEELKKLKKEKKVTEKQKVIALSKKEKEDLENFKKNFKKLEEESKIKDQKNKTIIDKMKKQLDEANAKNSDLLLKIKNLEKNIDNNLNNRIK